MCMKEKNVKEWSKKGRSRDKNVEWQAKRREVKIKQSKIKVRHYMWRRNNKSA